jgi:hypothetical protein
MEELFAREGLKESIQPTYTFDSRNSTILDYNELKPKVLEAEQHLLRILGFDFSQAQKNAN